VRPVRDTPKAVGNLELVDGLTLLVDGYCHDTALHATVLPAHPLDEFLLERFRALVTWRCR
jgi:hypothetical protein